MNLFFRWLIRGLLAAALLIGLGIAMSWAPDRPVAELSAQWAGEPSRFVSVQGMQVHIRDEGPRDDPRPMVLLHGTSASLHTWDGWVEALKGMRRVIRLDLPGFGLTGPQPEGDYSIAAYTRFVLDLMDVLGVRECVLGGNSLGGNIAWETAVAAPHRVVALVLVDAGGYPLVSRSMPLGFRMACIPVLRNLLEWILPRAVIESSLRNVYGNPAKVTRELVDRYYALALRAGNRRALVQRLEMPVIDNARAIQNLKLPVLVLWGGQDRLIPPDNASRFARDIGGSKLVVFEELGHVPHEEDPERTVAAVKAFLGVQ